MYVIQPSTALIIQSKRLCLLDLRDKNPLGFTINSNIELLVIIIRGRVECLIVFTDIFKKSYIFI